MAWGEGEATGEGDGVGDGEGDGVGEGLAAGDGEGLEATGVCAAANDVLPHAVKTNNSRTAAALMCSRHYRGWPERVSFVTSRVFGELAREGLAVGWRIWRHTGLEEALAAERESDRLDLLGCLHVGLGH